MVQIVGRDVTDTVAKQLFSDFVDWFDRQECYKGS